MSVQHLPPVREVVEPPVFAGPDHPMRIVTREVAFDGVWGPEVASRVSTLFNDLASEWDKAHRRSPERLAALEDALERGGVGSGVVLELGSGTGTGTEVLARHGFTDVVALDLAEEMLAIASPEFGARLRGDASSLPVASRSVGVVVLLNALLFPAEVDRVLEPDGCVVWVNTVGDQTPIHLPPDDVVEALPGHWVGVASRAGTGLWAVVRRG